MVYKKHYKGKFFNMYYIPLLFFFVQRYDFIFGLSRSNIHPKHTISVSPDISLLIAFFLKQKWAFYRIPYTIPAYLFRLYMSLPDGVRVSFQQITYGKGDLMYNFHIFVPLFYSNS